MDILIEPNIVSTNFDSFITLIIEVANLLMLFAAYDIASPIASKDIFNENTFENNLNIVFPTSATILITFLNIFCIDSIIFLNILDSLITSTKLL